MNHVDCPQLILVVQRGLNGISGAIGVLKLRARLPSWIVVLFALLSWHGSAAADMVLSIDHAFKLDSTCDFDRQSGNQGTCGAVQIQTTAYPFDFDAVPAERSPFHGVAMPGQSDETGVGSRSTSHRTSFPQAMIDSNFSPSSPALIAQMNRDAWEHIPDVPPFELLRPPQDLMTLV